MKKVKNKVKAAHRNDRSKRTNAQAKNRRGATMKQRRVTGGTLPWDDDDAMAMAVEQYSDVAYVDKRIERILEAAGAGGEIPDPVVAHDLYDALLAHLNVVCGFTSEEVVTWLRRALTGQGVARSILEDGGKLPRSIPHPDMPDAGIVMMPETAPVIGLARQRIAAVVGGQTEILVPPIETPALDVAKDVVSAILKESHVS